MGDTPHEVFSNILDYESVLQFPEGDDCITMSTNCKDIIQK